MQSKVYKEKIEMYRIFFYTGFYIINTLFFTKLTMFKDIILFLFCDESVFISWSNKIV